MKLKFSVIIFLMIFFSGCLRQKVKKEQETEQILEFIASLNLDFYTSIHGYYYHLEYSGYGSQIKESDSVTLIYSGYNLDENKFFVQDDTLSFIYGQYPLYEAWEDILPLCSEGAVGILIIPSYKKFSDISYPNLTSNSTVVFYFRVLSSDPEINALSLFYEFIESHKDTFDLYTDKVYVHTIFNGIGNPSTTLDEIKIEYQSKVLADTLVFDENNNFSFTLDNPDVIIGLKEAVKLLTDGSMAWIVVSPEAAYGENPPFDIPPYSALEITLRLLSADPDVAEHSNIKKFLYQENISQTDTLSNGVIKIDSNNVETEPAPGYGDTLLIKYYAKVINEKYPFESCSECKKALDSSNFLPVMTEALRDMHKGAKTYFIIPYKLAYGQDGSGVIPPYATILYQIELIDIIRNR